MQLISSALKGAGLVRSSEIRFETSVYLSVTFSQRIEVNCLLRIGTETRLDILHKVLTCNDRLK